MLSLPKVKYPTPIATTIKTKKFKRASTSQCFSNQMVNLFPRTFTFLFGLTFHSPTPQSSGKSFRFG